MTNDVTCICTLYPSVDRPAEDREGFVGCSDVSNAHNLMPMVLTEVDALSNCLSETNIKDANALSPHSPPYEMNWLNFLYACVGLLVFRFFYEFFLEWNYRRIARKRGCQIPVYEWNLPFGIPLVMQALQALRENQSIEDNARRIEKTGLDTVRVQGFTQSVVFTKDPEIIKAILATQFKEFDIKNRWTFMHDILGDGIFTLSGDGWFHSRHLLKPQFTNDNVSRVQDLERSTKILCQICHEKSMTGQYFDVQDLFFKLTLDTATDYLFGSSTDELLNVLSKEKAHDWLNDQSATDLPVSGSEFAVSFNLSQDWIVYRILAQKFYKLVRGKKYTTAVDNCNRFIDYYVDKVLQEKQAKNGQFDENEKYFFLKELAKQTDDRILMRSQAMNILLAGRDTSAALMSFIIAYLCRHKEVMHELRQAILQDFGTTTEDINFHTLKRCDYLKNVINETLRLNPIVPVNSRFPVKDTVLPTGGGPDGKSPMFVEKNTPVTYNSYALHRDPKTWGPDANEFKPDRWRSFRPPSWTYIPFNGGPRICLGQQLALTEVSYVIVRLFQHFEDVNMAPVDLQHPVYQSRKLTASVAGGVNVIFTPATDN